jgi:vancomycin resistance protein VanJ
VRPALDRSAAIVPGRQRPTRHQGLVRLSLLNLAGLLLLWGLERFVGERYWLTALLVYVPQAPFVAPALLLALVALARHHGRALALNLAALAAAAVLLLHVALPLSGLGGRLRTAAGSEIPLRVLTFNVEHGEAGAPAIARAIRAAHPDLFCLQEAIQGVESPDPTPALSRAFAGWHSVRRGELFVAARFPIRAVRPLRLGPDSGYRSMLEVELRVGGRPVTLYVVHFSTAIHPETLMHHQGSLAGYLDRTAAVRLVQAQTVARYAASRRGAVLIAGDFNSPPGSRCLRRLGPRFTDCFARGGWGFGYTYPARLPLLRIDHIFASPEFAVRRSATLDTRASDHRALVADLVLRSSPSATYITRR